MRTEDLDDLDAIQAKMTKSRSRSTGGRGGSLALRRTVGITLMAGMAFAIYWIIFHTTIAEPVLALISPMQDGVDWILEDPSRAWMAVAAIVIPHIGMYYLIFEDR